jgi:hypothetical protein
VMPAGTNRIGRHSPTTPGSISPCDERISAPAAMSIDVLARTAARMRSQPRSRMHAMTANPHAHTASRAPGFQSVELEAEGTYGIVSGNGSAIWTASVERAGTAGAAGPHSTRFPRPINRPNGSTNLTDALNHNQ